MSTPGITLRPIKLIDGGYEVNEVFFEDVRVPADQLVGEENQGWTLRQVPAEQRAHRHRPDRHDQGVAGPGQGARRGTPRPNGGTLLEDPLFAARVAEVENELLALELTQLRVSGSEADGKPNPASSILKLRGSQLQQAVTELLVDVAGPDALPFGAGDDIASPPWAQHAAPQLPELPQDLDLRRHQRGAAHHHRLHDSGTVRTSWTST